MTSDNSKLSIIGHVIIGAAGSVVGTLILWIGGRILGLDPGLKISLIIALLASIIASVLHRTFHDSARVFVVSAVAAIMALAVVALPWTLLPSLRLKLASEASPSVARTSSQPTSQPVPAASMETVTEHPTASDETDGTGEEVLSSSGIAHPISVRVLNPAVGTLVAPTFDIVTSVENVQEHETVWVAMSDISNRRFYPQAELASGRGTTRLDKVFSRERYGTPGKLLFFVTQGRSAYLEMVDHLDLGADETGLTLADFQHEPKRLDYTHEVKCCK